MGLGSGEYLIVSSCVKAPYKVESIISLVSKLNNYGAQFGKATFLKMSPEESNYNLEWNGVDEIHEEYLTPLSVNLERFFLSKLEILFKDYIESRLHVGFLDEETYEVSLIFNYTKLFDEEKSLEIIRDCSNLIEDLGFVLFEEIKPLYGSIGIERNVCGLQDIRRGECIFPSDKAYYCSYFYDNGKNLFGYITKKAIFLRKLGNEGVYFRKTEIDDYNLLETSGEYEMLSKLKQLV